MGTYVPIWTEIICFFIYICIFLVVIWAPFLSWSIKEEKQKEVWKWGAVTCAILGCLTAWFGAATS
jgi:uncharacterized membrane protein